MAKPRNLPEQITTLRTFPELTSFVKAFGDGHLNLMLLLGAPGSGKSRAVAEVLGPDAFWINGQLTAFGLFRAAYEHRHEQLVLDDVDGLFRDRSAVRLLKSLTQSESVRRISWETNAAALDCSGIPRQFETSSRMLIIGNQWREVDADVTALQDRGHVLHFAPSPLELHRQAASWFWSQDIYDAVGGHLHLLQEHSLRAYTRAWELKVAGLDWKTAILSRCTKGVQLEVAKLRADETFGSEEARVQAFVKAGHGCRSTYFNWVKKLQPAESVPHILLTNKTPPPTCSSTGDLVGDLMKRYGRLGNG